MKPSSARLCLLVIAAALLGACGHLEITSSDPNRTVKGTVATNATLPAGSEILVRVLATGAPAAIRHGMPDTAGPARALPAAEPAERMLGEFRQVLAAAAPRPVPFQIEFQADDALMRRGVNLDVRVSVAGKLRYRTISAHAVTLSSVAFPQVVSVQPVQ